MYKKRTDGIVINTDEAAYNTILAQREAQKAIKQVSDELAEIKAALTRIESERK